MRVNGRRELEGIDVGLFLEPMSLGNPKPGVSEAGGGRDGGAGFVQRGWNPYGDISQMALQLRRYDLRPGQQPAVGGV